jgi:pimeloyl-ACP methyl ester carboxylesterase
MPGYAPSSLEGPFDWPSVTRRVLDLIDELSPSEPVRIVGHDWGAVVAQYALATTPTRFRSAAILAVPHMLSILDNAQEYPSQFRRSSYMGLFQLPVLSDRIVRLRDFAYIERLWRLWSPGFHPGDEYMDELKLCLRSSLPAPLRYYRPLKDPRVIRDTYRLLQQGPIEVPTIYLHGERDGCIDVRLCEGQDAWFSALFEQVVLSGAGHFLHLERPAEVNDAITAYFNAN